MDVREKLIEILNNSFEKQYEKRCLLTAPHTAEDLITNGVKFDVEEFPAADVAPVQHGKWEWDTEDIYRCSNCAEKSRVKEVMGRPEWDYCPNCGAKMDGEDQKC